MHATRYRTRLRTRTLREQSHRLVDKLPRLPAAAWVCAAIACLNATCWSILSPPFEVTDEPAHFAYVATLAETGSLPSSDREEFASAEGIALTYLHFPTVFFRPAERTISTEAEQSTLERGLSLPLDRAGRGDAGVAASEPPLYYALETIPYRLAAGGTVLDRLAAMRLLSALMGGLTALFVFLFVREALPGARWAWAVGGLSVALAPLLGMISGAVNPDALCFAISAALFYGLARGFRRGLTPRLAGAIGVIIVLGYLTKLNFLGLIPGAALGLLVLSIRAARTSRLTACRSLALAMSIVAAPALLIVLIRGGSLQFGTVPEAVSQIGKRGSILGEIEYIWQFYLPRLPGMSADFHGVLTTRVLWFNGLVGLYGWLDTTFPNWVYNAALVPACLIALLLASALFKYRKALRDRLIEAVVYLTMSAGALAIVGASDYLKRTPGEFREPRYLLPMLALGGAAMALAARGAGRRWGPVAGLLIVLLFLAHDIFSQLLVISRFYG
jgi:4-amino-4-deoxy-L-arabinose transferase-like glycosyltransferase